MKKIIWGILSVFFICLVLVVGFYFWGIGKKEQEQHLVTFVIEPGTTKTTIAKNLETAGLIRSQYALDMYLFFTGGNIQAGEYELSANMTPIEMIKKFIQGDIKINTVTVTLVEGKRLTDYAKVFEENLSFTKTDFLNTIKDKEYLTSLISSGKYWFLTDEILDEEIYYPLEGYLYPDTYEFLEDADEKTVIETILNHTLSKLEPYHSSILASGKSPHEILTMASIVEKEANTLEDREKASQVFYKRLELNMSLGSDVTAYYGVEKDMDKSLTWEELNDPNPYNTRLTDGRMNGKLPIGPIANPSSISIEAAIHPSNTNYLYFVANVCTGEVFFQENINDFYAKGQELQKVCDAN